MSKKNLFNLSEIGKRDTVLDSAAAPGEKGMHKANYSGKAGRFCRALDDLLTIETHHIDFMTAGNLSLHNIIELVLNKFGPCLEMYISTWAIKEAAARSLFQLCQQGMIGSLHGIFDYRIDSLDHRSFQLVKPLMHRYELTKNHAKVILIEYPDRCITMLCSANMSNNPRIEAGFISLCPATFNFHKSWMTQVFSGKKVY